MAEQDRMEGLYQALVQRALEARESSYSPIRKFLSATTMKLT